MAVRGEVGRGARVQSGAMIDSAVLPAPVLVETLALAFDADPVFRWWIPGIT